MLHTKVFYLCWTMIPKGRVSFTEHFDILFAFFWCIFIFLFNFKVYWKFLFVLKLGTHLPAAKGTRASVPRATGRWASGHAGRPAGQRGPRAGSTEGDRAHARGTAHGDGDSRRRAASRCLGCVATDADGLRDPNEGGAAISRSSERALPAGNHGGTVVRWWFANGDHFDYT